MRLASASMFRSGPQSRLCDVPRPEGSHKRAPRFRVGALHCQVIRMQTNHLREHPPLPARPARAMPHTNKRKVAKPWTMNAALAAWNGRIAPVFDVVGQIRFLKINSGRVVAETEEALEGLTPAEKALRLAKLGVDLLICGAISRPVQSMVEAYGIRVVPFVTGDLSGVIQALVEDRLADALLAMPGCRGGARQRRRGGVISERRRWS